MTARGIAAEAAQEGFNVVLEVEAPQRGRSVYLDRDVERASFRLHPHDRFAVRDGMDHASRRDAGDSRIERLVAGGMRAIDESILGGSAGYQEGIASVRTVQTDSRGIGFHLDDVRRRGENRRLDEHAGGKEDAAGSCHDEELPPGQRSISGWELGRHVADGKRISSGITLAQAGQGSEESSKTFIAEAPGSAAPFVRRARLPAGSSWAYRFRDGRGR